MARQLSAINTYLNLEFLPVYVDDTQPERWENILKKLKLPPMATQIAQVQESLPTKLWVKVSH